MQAVFDVYNFLSIVIFCRTKIKTVLGQNPTKLSEDKQRPTKSEFGRFNVPSGRLKHKHMNLDIPLLLPNDNTYILTIVDRFTHWSEESPIPDVYAASIAKSVVDQYRHIEAWGFT